MLNRMGGKKNDIKEIHFGKDKKEKCDVILN